MAPQNFSKPFGAQSFRLRQRLRAIRPGSLAVPAKRRGGPALPLGRIAQVLHESSAIRASRLEEILKGENLFPRSNQGRKRSYNSCEIEVGKTRPVFQSKGPGGAPPRARVELLQGGPRRGNKFSHLKLRERPVGRGFTLTELILTVILFAILVVSASLIFRTLLIAWPIMERRGGIDINLNRGLEQISRDLRQAKAIQSTAGRDEIRYTLGTTTSTSSIFYLFNAGDSYVPPPAFNQTSYQLRKATLSGGINGTFTYGAGDDVVNDVVPPPTSDLSLSGNLLTIDLSAKRLDETIRSRTQIRTRNV